jgi:hypothetical protein
MTQASARTHALCASPKATLLKLAQPDGPRRRLWPFVRGRLHPSIRWTLPDRKVDFRRSLGQVRKHSESRHTP